MKKRIIFIPLTSIWYEEKDLFIRIKERCGLYRITISEIEELHFLADSFHDDNEDGRVFKFIGVEKVVPG